MVCLLVKILICSVILAPSLVFAVDSAQDADLTINPIVIQYKQLQLSTTSAASTFTITNMGVSDRTVSTVSLAGVDANEFVIGTHSCSAATLSSGQSCDVPVSFAPKTRGTKNAELRISTDDSETPVLTAYVTNYTSAIVEAQRRLPPVLATNSLPESMQASNEYTLSWTLEGYHDSYYSYAVLFDCTGETDCGAFYSDASKFAESGPLSPASVTQGNWTYHGAATKLHTYEWNFTVPVNRADSSAWDVVGTDIVLRIYRKSDIDNERASSSVSLLIPGNQSDRYYDTAGRRLLKTIVP
ncbi:choice-of-anchor D domain-containing protein [Deltaproteobacteria bacterium IMCC39524]|nr:choice-of-anchor D domain-containing protein [Deltaproteobacteria bacterium IMCC39524]